MVTLRCRDLPRKKHEKEEEEEKREKNEIKPGSHQGRREGTTYIRVVVDSPVVLSEWGIVQNVPVCFAAEVFFPFASLNLRFLRKLAKESLRVKILFSNCQKPLHANLEFVHLGPRQHLVILLPRAQIT